MPQACSSTLRKARQRYGSFVTFTEEGWYGSSAQEDGFMFKSPEESAAIGGVCARTLDAWSIAGHLMIMT